MNRAVLIGNIATDIDSRTTQNGIDTCSFRLAVQRRFKNANGEHDADFINIVCWRQTADYIARYAAKGKRLAVEGSIQTRTYEAQDGSKRYVTEVIADSAELLTPKGDSAPKEEKTDAQGFTEVNGDELPF